MGPGQSQKFLIHVILFQMSTRWYPVYQRGNPQLRVFLPNFWMKLVKEPHDVKAPPNHLKFIVSSEMTKMDVKQYLEKIYNIPVMNVHTKNFSGPTWQNLLRQQISRKNELYKEDDYKVAYVLMPKDYKFEFPDVTKKPEDQEKQEKNAEDEVDMAKKQFAKYAKGTKRGIPSFFGI